MEDQESQKMLKRLHWLDLVRDTRFEVCRQQNLHAEPAHGTVL